MSQFHQTGKLPQGYDFLMLTYSQLMRSEKVNWKASCVRDMI